MPDKDKIKQKSSGFNKRNVLIISVSACILVTAVMFLTIGYVVKNHIFGVYKNALISETSVCAELFNNSITEDVDKLSDIADDIAGYESLKSSNVVEMLRIQGANNKFSKLHILHSDGDIIDVDGNVFNANPVVAAEIFEKKTGVSFIDNSAVYDSDKLVIYVPIVDGKAELMAAIDLEKTARDISMSNNKLSRTILFQAKDGRVLVDLGDIEENGTNDASRTNQNLYKIFTGKNITDGYTYDELKEEILKGKKGFFTAHGIGKSSSGFYYVSFAPVGYNDWYLMQFMSKDIVVESQENVYNSVFKVIVIFGLMILCVIIFSVTALEKVYRRKEKENVKIISEKNMYDARNKLIAGVSDELKLPIDSMMETMQLCEINADNPDRVRGYIEKQRVACEQLSIMIEDMLDTVNIDEYDKKEVSLGTALHNIVSLVQGKIAQKGVDFKLSIIELKHETVVCNERVLGRILLNIIDNAAKSVSENGVISLSLKEYETDEDDVSEYEYVISDVGVGEAGLSAVIAGEMAKKLGGTVKYVSIPERGNRIIARLPLKTVDADRQLHPDIRQYFKGSNMIVVDDDPQLILWMEYLASFAGLKCYSYNSPVKAIDGVRELYENGEEAAIMFFGFNMPQMSSTGLAAAMRNIVGKDVPIIIQTSKSIEGAKQDPALAAVNMMVAEPIFCSEFINILNGIATGADKEKRSIPDMSGKRILLVDDNAQITDTILEYLKYTGAHVDVMNNGENALECFTKAGEWYYSIILMDIKMPYMDGYEVAKAIRSMKNPYAQNVPIIALMATAFLSDIKRCREAGINSYLEKPFGHDKIYDELRKWFI